MSPTRPTIGSRRNSSSSFKPYARGATPTSTPTMYSSPTVDAKWPNTTEHPGFPTYAQYKQVETTYLQSLTPRRQGKALISQALFDRIWDVLHQPDLQGETAQFRFWARKMFTISNTHRVTLGVADDMEEAPQEVLLHDNLLVAIQEQLYDLLCYCHGSTSHGGRDKTCALIRKHYTWVPKDLVSNFIKSCPTCIMKKCGNLDTASFVNHMVDPKPVEETTLPAIRYFFQNMYSGDGSEQVGPSTGDSVPWPTTGGLLDPPMSSASSHIGEDPLEAAYREAIMRARGIKASLAGLGGPPNARAYPSFPMSREVSLYKGLPNGWHLRHSNYASAYAEFMRTKDLPMIEEPGPVRRPRVPSILPLWGPDQFPSPEFEVLEDEMFGNEHIPSLVELEQSPEHTQGSDSQTSSMSLPYLIPSSEASDTTKECMQDCQIDPVLMQYSHDHTTPSRSGDTKVEASESPSGMLASSANHPSSSSLKRNPAPLRLNLNFPTEKTFQALFVYRESFGECNMTPDSPMTTWHPGNPSPASSESSSSSQLSAFPMASAFTSPASSALPTPVDELGVEGSGNILKGKRPMVLPEFAHEELSGGIQAVCGIRG